MRSEAEVLHAWYLLQTLNDIASRHRGEPDVILPSQELIDRALMVIQWVTGVDNGFEDFRKSIEACFAAGGYQVEECEGGARLTRLRAHHKPKSEKPR
jgi:hypothetical protein